MPIASIKRPYVEKNTEMYLSRLLILIAYHEVRAQMRAFHKPQSHFPCPMVHVMGLELYVQNITLRGINCTCLLFAIGNHDRSGSRVQQENIGF